MVVWYAVRTSALAVYRRTRTTLHPLRKRSRRQMKRWRAVWGKRIAPAFRRPRAMPAETTMRDRPAAAREATKPAKPPKVVKPAKFGPVEARVRRARKAVLRARERVRG